MKNYNQWANELNVSAYYIKPTPPASGHYFNSSVYCKPKSNIFMKLFRKLLGFIAVLILMSSCSRYINAGGGGCGVWMPKKFEKGKVFHTRSHPMYRMGVH